MSNDFIRRIKSEISRAEHASDSVIKQIEEELERNATAELWILHGDALQLADEEKFDVEEAEASYMTALELDPKAADAYESLGHFTFAVHDDARAAVQYFQRAIELGAGASAREGLKEAQDELTELS